MFEICMDGPAKNALGTEMMSWLLQQLEAAGDQPVLLTGTGDAFSAGLQLKEVAGLDTEGMGRFIELLERMVLALFHHPAPTAAAVNGHAIAGGCVLTLCCDVRIATDNDRARIGLNEAMLGLVFPPRVLQIVAARVPPQHLEEVVMGAALYAPAGALRLGMVDAVSADCVGAAKEALAARAKVPAHAYRAAKQAIRGSVGQIDAAEAEAFRREALPTWTSPALKERLLAVLRR